MIRFQDGMSRRRGHTSVSFNPWAALAMIVCVILVALAIAGCSQKDINIANGIHAELMRARAPTGPVIMVNPDL